MSLRLLGSDSGRRERAGKQARRHAEAAGDVLELLALGDDLGAIAAYQHRGRQEDSV